MGYRKESTQSRYAYGTPEVALDLLYSWKKLFATLKVLLLTCRRSRTLSSWTPRSAERADATDSILVRCTALHRVHTITATEARQSLKNVPGGTDVLGKWKYVPGNIRIRASIFTNISMLFYINIPFKLIVTDASRIAIKHECIFKNFFIVLFGCPINLI